MPITQILFEVLLPVFVVVGIGWGLDRALKLDLRTLVRLNLYCLVPAFIFVKVTTAEIGTRALYPVGITLGVIFSMMLVSTLIGKLGRLEETRVRSLRLVTMFYNCGNFGIPVISFAFGPEGEALQVFVLMTMNLSVFTIGLFLAQGGSAKAGVIGLLKQPSIYALAAALVVRGTGLPLVGFDPVWKPLQLMAVALVPGALLTLGVQLSQTKVPRIDRSLGLALAIRLLLGPVIAFALATLLGADDLVRSVVTVAAAAPTAINIAMLAHEFDGDSRYAAAAVFYTTIASLVTVAAVLALV